MVLGSAKLAKPIVPSEARRMPAVNSRPGIPSPRETGSLLAQELKRRLVVRWRRQCATGPCSFRTPQSTSDASGSSRCAGDIFTILTLVDSVLLEEHDIPFLAFAIQLCVVVCS